MIIITSCTGTYPQGVDTLTLCCHLDTELSIRFNGLHHTCQFFVNGADYFSIYQESCHVVRRKSLIIHGN